MQTYTNPYLHMYTRMFNAVTDAQAQLESALRLLRQAQRDCEELYLRAGEQNGLRREQGE